MDSLLNTDILLVEDEFYMRRLLVSALNSVGFATISEAKNGLEALQLLESRVPDIMFTDFEMKPVDGFELVRAIRMGATPAPRDMPVVFLSGLSDISTLSSASQLDVQGFLVKPVSANDLRDKLREALHKHFQLQPADSYRAMAPLDAVEPAPSASGAATGVPPGTAEEQPHCPTADADADNTECSRIDLLMLEPGMVIHGDLTAHGKLLLKRGTILQPRHISVLQDMRTMLDTKCFYIKRPENTG